MGLAGRRDDLAGDCVALKSWLPPAWLQGSSLQNSVLFKSAQNCEHGQDHSCKGIGEA